MENRYFLFIYSCFIAYNRMSRSAFSSGYSTWRQRRQSRSKSRSRAPLSRHSQTLYEAPRLLRLHISRNHKGYIELNLSGQALQTLPQDISYFTRLEVLNVSHNSLCEVPASLARLRGLRVLLLQENKIMMVPDTITNCTHLTEINLTRNKLSNLPRNIDALKNLRILKLGQNEFVSLPHDVGQLQNLTYLDLQGNRIWYLPFSMHGLRKLKYLNLADNKFEHLPIPICQVSSLKLLNLKGNSLQSLSPDFESLKNLRELNLSYNKFDSIPGIVYRLKELRFLNIAANDIKYIPHHIQGLPNLHILHIQGNRLANLPNTFKNLQYLNMSNNCLYNVSLVGMTRLKNLNASNNFLENLPMGVYTLTKLEILRLSNNQIKYVSQDLAHLKNLRVLDLGNNKLVSFPQVIDQMHRLDYFNVKGNQIKHRITLQYGEIPANQDDMMDNRHIYASKRNPHQDNNRYKSKKREKSPSTRSTTMLDSQDLDELLLNGFSRKHIENNSESVMWRDNKNKANKVDKEPLKNILQHIADLDAAEGQNYMSPADRETDFRLLGICNQLEMLLNKQLLQPVLSLKEHPTGKSFSDKSIVPVADGVWRLSDNKSPEAVGVIMSRTESFTVTPSGGEFVSTVNPKVSINVPNKGVSVPLEVSLKIIKVERDMLHSLQEDDGIISNILAIGPIIFLKTEEKMDLNSLVTMTIPSPTSTTHEQNGYLHVLTINSDNSCSPNSSGYQITRACIRLNTWHLSGKTVILAKAKCKYKACSAVESLLKCMFHVPIKF
ncbi:leucine-rich repeat protein SHOC-2-like [Argopecten irradians]|uniref:leucine-rich repeat protein SHOC-2-like n=1 Tax=Argopecten irradians TaxID=31199 RepID=UPI0037108D85